MGIPPTPSGAVDEGEEQRQLLSYPGPFTFTTITIGSPVQDLGVITLFDLDIDLYPTVASYKYSNYYHDTFTEYYPRLLEHGQISIALPDLFTGIPGTRSATVTGSNVDPTNTEAPTLSYILANVGDVRGARAKIRLYSLTLQQNILVLNGTVTDYDDGESEWSITVETEEPSIFDIELPKRRLRDVYPDIDLTSARGQDPPVIVVHGTMRRVPLFLVDTITNPYSDDTIEYYYGAIRSPEAGELTVENVYRDGALVDESEYVVIENPEGLITVRFDLDQRDESGRNLSILADLVSTEFAENPARVQHFWLTDLTYGLGQLADETQQNIAITDYDGTGQRISGGLDQLINARALFSYLLLHGAYITRNDSGEFYTVVDTLDKHPQPEDDHLQLGLNDSGGWHNIVSLDSVLRRRTDETFKSLLIKGIWDSGFDQQRSAFLATAMRSRNIPGVAKEIENPMIGDVATLEREVDYLFRRYNAQDRSVSLVTTSETYVVDLGALIKVTIPHKLINGITFEIREKASLGGDSSGFQLLLAGYDATAFTYQAGTPVVSPLASVLTDYRRTNPEEPSHFQVVSSSVRTGAEGIVESLVKLSADAPAVNCTHLVFTSFRAGSAIPRSEVRVPARRRKQPTGTLTVYAELPLTPGLLYDLECYAINADNDDDRQESTRAQILNYTAIGDTTAPDVPLTLVVTHGTGKSLSLNWDDNTEDDLKHYKVERSTDPTFTTTTHLADIAASRFVDISVLYETYYYYRVRAVDHSGNMSNWSNTGIGFVSKIRSIDYGERSVLSGHRQSLNVIFFAFSIGAHESYAQSTGLLAAEFLYTSGVLGMQATTEWDSSSFSGDLPNGTRLHFLLAGGPVSGPFDEHYVLGFWNGTAVDWASAGRINGW